MNIVACCSLSSVIDCSSAIVAQLHAQQPMTFSRRKQTKTMCTSAFQRQIMTLSHAISARSGLWKRSSGARRHRPQMMSSRCVCVCVCARPRVPTCTVCVHARHFLIWQQGRTKLVLKQAALAKCSVNCADATRG
jgi:hypothetical protein